MSNKPIKAKPHFYAVCFEGLQQIAKDLGYNLVIHGSMNRDMDLVAITWINEPKSHLELLHAFCEYLGIVKFDDIEHYCPSILPGGRSSYILNLNRGCKFNGYLDAEYYIDLSITPFVTNLI